MFGGKATEGGKKYPEGNLFHSSQDFVGSEGGRVSLALGVARSVR